MDTYSPEHLLDCLARTLLRTMTDEEIKAWLAIYRSKQGAFGEQREQRIKGVLRKHYKAMRPLDGS